MRAAGATYAEIVAASGVSMDSVSRFFNPEYHARQLARVAAYHKEARATNPVFRARRTAQTKAWRLRKDAKCEAYDTGRRYEDVCADWGIKP